MIGITIELKYDNHDTTEHAIKTLGLHETAVLTVPDPQSTDEQIAYIKITKILTGWLYRIRELGADGHGKWQLVYVPEQVDVEAWKKDWIGFMELKEKNGK